MSDLQWNKKFALEQAGDDQDLLTELLDLLRSSSQGDLQKIKAALKAGDGNGVADAAHSIKGASASLGFEGLRAVAYEFEKGGRAAELAGLDPAVLENMILALNDIAV
jgi:HPt (histidine-containing phosphotransfer) domain-containing protein